MIFCKFRKIVQEYCSVHGYDFPSKKRYKELHYGYNQSLTTAPVPDELETTIQYLDSEDFEKKENMNGNFCLVSTGCTTPCAAQPQWPIAVPIAVACNQKQEGNTPMNYNETEANRKYLNGRVNDLRYAKRDELYKLFRMNNPSAPTTYKDLIDAIKTDKFEIDAKVAARVDATVEDDGRWYGSPFDAIKWKLENAPDLDGYRAAEKQAEKQLTAAKDIINTGDAAAGLKAVQDFEAWTPTVATTTVQ